MFRLFTHNYRIILFFGKRHFGGYTGRLYRSAIQVDGNLFLVQFKEPTETPPISDYMTPDMDDKVKTASKSRRLGCGSFHSGFDFTTDIAIHSVFQKFEEYVVCVVKVKNGSQK